MGKFKAKLQWEGFKPKYGRALRTTPALDTEAEAFVIKLWRMLIYEVLKASSP